MSLKIEELMKRIYLYILTAGVLLLMNVSGLYAQVPAIQWDRAFGGGSDDDLHSLTETSDGGYLLGGYSYSSVSGDKSEGSKGTYDYWVVKTDASGNKLWDRTFGGGSHDILRSITETTDGGYLLGGHSYSSSSGDKSEDSRGESDYWLVKIDASGNKLWDRSFGGNYSEIFYSLTATSDGGFLLGGYSNSPASGDKSEGSKGAYDYWIVKTDASGNILWNRTFGGNSWDQLLSLTATSDGGFLLGGQSLSSASGDKSESSSHYDFWVVKIDASGNKLWDRTFGGSSIESLASLTEISDGGFLLGGYSLSNISGDKTEDSKGSADYWVVKTDASGNMLWDKTIGGDLADAINSLTETTDGGFLLGGMSDSPASGDKSEGSRGGYDYWVVKIDASGNKLWDKTIGGGAWDVLFSLIETIDGNFLLGGYSRSTASGEKSEASKGASDYWVVKLGDNLDAALPVLSGVPADEAVECNIIPAPATVIAEDDVDGALAVNFSETRTDGSCPNSYTLSRTWSATDAAGNTATAIQRISVTDDTAPVLDGIPASLTASTDAGTCEAIVDFPVITASDNCGTALISYSHASGSTFPLGETVVTTTAMDECENSISATFTVTVTNQLPDPSSITPSTVDPIQINSGVTTSATFTDNNIVSAVWSWGDLSTSAGVISGNSVSGSHTYVATGVYTVELTLTDACNESATSIYQYVVVYDPDGGFVTGGGWIESPAEAYKPDPALSGRANFGFFSKYKKGATVPSGHTNFQFQVADLHFSSTIYEWLVISGATARYKGEGTINGSGWYGFILSATDGQVNGGGGVDKFRIKIWDKSNGDLVVYDNNLTDEADDAYAETAISGGSIVVHDGSKKNSISSNVTVEKGNLEAITGFAAYPNPIAEKGLWLEFPSMKEDAELLVMIYDLNGRKIAEKQFTSEKAGSKQLWDLDHQNWPSGMYMMIIRGEGVVHQQKLIK